MVDISGELDNYAMKGVQHKYDETLLVITTPECFKYCDYCFRKRFTKKKEYKEVFNVTSINDITEYIKNHSTVSNVLLTGGDFLKNSNETIEIYLDTLSKTSIEYIRIGTKSLVHNIKRIDSELIQILEKYNKIKRIIIQTHFNTIKNITSDVESKVRKLRSIDISLYNQTVILDGINNKEEELLNLCRQLYMIGIKQYYFFHCRPVEGNERYRTNVFNNASIFKNIRSKLPGNQKQFKYVLTNRLGKIEIVGLSKDAVFVKFNQCVDKKYVDVVTTIDKRSLWITEKEIMDSLEGKI